MTAVVTTNNAASTVQWDQELRGAQNLMRSGLVPADIRTPEAAMFIILTGRDLGMSPVQSLRSIRVIKGKVEVAADAQLGKFHSAGGRSRFVTLTNDTAKLELSAPWLTAPHLESFTLDDAKTAGLAGGDSWRRYPKAMLRSRAITAGLKSVGFDACAGIYGAGEVGGEATVIGDEVVVTEAVAEDAPAVLVLPGKPESWGGSGGLALEECNDKVLAAFLKWGATEERTAKFAAELNAAQIIVEARAAAAAEDGDEEDES
jgi:hypothetical protein